MELRLVVKLVVKLGVFLADPWVDTGGFGLGIDWFVWFFMMLLYWIATYKLNYLYIFMYFNISLN